MNGFIFAQSTDSIKPLWITHVTIHQGNGTIIPNGMVCVENGKIAYVGTGKEIRLNREAINLLDGQGQHLYPGFIALNTILGLSEIEAARPTLDFAETGSLNPNVRALIAFNTDSKILPTVTVNGVLLAQIVPDGERITGRASVVRLKANNWEDAAVASDNGLFLKFPELPTQNDPSSFEKRNKEVQEEIQQLNTFFLQSKAWNVAQNRPVNVKFESMANLWSGKMKLYVQANNSKTILAALQFCSQLGIKPILVGALEAEKQLEAIKLYAEGVILQNPLRLPSKPSDPIDAPYEQASKLVKAGILTGICLEGAWQQRSLAYSAGSCAAYGLSQEEALMLITSNAAKLSGVENQYGTIESGKSATFLLTNGDVLDMKSSKILSAWLDGQTIDLLNHQEQLYKKYKERYKIPEQN